jgi:putative glycosyltransferase (TIGR04372 family)
MFFFFRLFELIGKLTGTIIITPTPYVVGNAAEEIYFGLLKARTQQKKLIILFPFELPWKFTFNLIDIDIFNIESDYLLRLPRWINFFGRSYITIFYGINKAIGMALRLIFSRKLYRSALINVPMIGVTTLWQPKLRMLEFSWSIVENYKWREQLQAKLLVYPENNIYAYADRWRQQIGLPIDSWFVCLHVRESGFHNDSATERNASITNYYAAIKKITERGGWVVRLGDRSMTRLTQLDRVIDYPFSEAKSPSMDMYLISECTLYIGMTSGIYDVALLFQRPVILANMSNWLFGIPPKINDICLPKHVYSKSKRRFLSVREWLAEPWGSISYRSLDADYVLYENSSLEIENAVKEFFERDNDWKPTPLQLEFHRLRVAHGKEIIGKPIFAGDNPQQKYSEAVDNPFYPDYIFYDILERYRLASRLDSVVGMMSSQYIQDNWELDAFEATKVHTPLQEG